MTAMGRKPTQGGDMFESPIPPKKRGGRKLSELFKQSLLLRQIFLHFNFNSQAPSWRLPCLVPADGFAKMVTHWLKWLKS